MWGDTALCGELNELAHHATDVGARADARVGKVESFGQVMEAGNGAGGLGDGEGGLNARGAGVVAFDVGVEDGGLAPKL